MHWSKYLISIAAAASLTITSYAATRISSTNQQLVLVTSSSWDSSTAKLQRYERSNTNSLWQPVGKPIDVLVGKKGMARIKKEGDLKTPSGIYSFGTAFGFAKQPKSPMILPYLPITSTTVCVDDVKSRYYNRIIDSSQVPKNSWHSGEQMGEKIPQYTWGTVINYNTPRPIRGAGSCIFMHVWENSTAPTVGCIAMSKSNVKQLLVWLDPSKKPVIALFPENIYEKLRNAKKLPG